MAEKEGLITNSLPAISQSYGPPAASKTLRVLSNPARELNLLPHHKKSPASTMRGTIYGGERVFLTLVHSFPAMSINMPYSPLNTAY